MPSRASVEPAWVSRELIVYINLVETAATGEPHAILAEGLLQSAQAKPRNRWSYDGEEDLLRLAVGLMLGVAQNHPFQQGNKRTGFLAGLAMLRLNGFTFEDAMDTRAIADAFVELIEHKVDEAAFAGRLRPHVVAAD